MKISALIQFLGFLLLLFAAHGGGCQIPELLNGTWFIRELDHGYPIIINSTNNSISRPNPDEMIDLGNCMWNKDDLYVFSNPEKQCSRCLIIKQLHKNILYSREGFECKPTKEVEEEGSLDSFCTKSLWQNEEHYYWFRLDYKPIFCPFREFGVGILGGLSFEFRYKIDGITCSSPISRAVSCLDHTKLELQYSACRDQKNSVAKAEKLTCVGDFKEGDATYLVVDVRPLKSHGTPAPRERFRCFIYEKIFDNDASRPTLLGYDMGTFQEATCSGLQSPEGAETVLYLRKVNVVSPEWKTCRFPQWLTEHKWMDMGAMVEFTIPPKYKNRTIHIDSRNRQDFHENHNAFNDRSQESKFFPLSHSNLRCLQITNTTGGNSENIAFIAEYTVGCKIRNVCLHFIRRSEYIFQIYYLPPEDLAQPLDWAKCANATLLEVRKEATMISINGIKRPCPLSGNFSVNIGNFHDWSIEDMADSSASQLFKYSNSQWSIGCTNNDRIDVEIENYVGSNHMDCLDTFSINQVNYTILETENGKLETLFCLASRSNPEISLQPSNFATFPSVTLTNQDCIKLHSEGNEDEDETTKRDSLRSQVDLIATGPCDSGQSSPHTAASYPVKESQSDSQTAKSIEPGPSSLASKFAINYLMILLSFLILIQGFLDIC